MAEHDPRHRSVHCEPSFHFAPDATLRDAMAERLRQAPWLVLSAGAHAVIALVLLLLLPGEPRREPAHKVMLTDTTPPPVEPPKPPEPPKIQPEVVEHAPITEELVVAPSEAEAVADAAAETLADSSPDTTALNSTIGVGEGPKRGPYTKRGPPGKRGGGGGPGTQSHVTPALQWLQRHQDADGKWDCDGFAKHDDPAAETCTGGGSATHDVGVTGLALLAFLGDGSTLRSGPYAANIKKSVNWLRKQQDPATGLFGARAAHDYIYDHAIATYAMCEAFGLSNYETLRPIAQKALEYLESHRNPYGVWRYQPRGEDNDTSITGWCIMAYESGRYFGLAVNDAALKHCEQWLDQVSDPTGLHGYTKAGELSARKGREHEARFPLDKGEAMTAVGLFCRFFLGQDPKDHPVMRNAADRILRKPPIADPKAGGVDHYYWYYATYALFQMGGPHWTQWQKLIEPAVCTTQILDRAPAKKNLHGSWDPVCAWGEDGGRVYSTATLALTLQAAHRYTRLVR